MSSIPFQPAHIIQAQGLPVPDRTRTATALFPLDLSRPTVINDLLAGYRLMYGLDQLAAEHWQGYVQSAGFRIHVQVFFNQQHIPAKGTVWLLHGYLEHSAIYQPIIAEILQQGFQVVTYDLPGHGLSDGVEAAIKDFEDYQHILTDIAQLLAHQLPKPWLGIGQSTGGAIWLHHLLAAAEQRREPLVQRVLLLSPLVRPARSSWWHNAIGLGIVRRIKRQVPRHFKRNNHNPEFLRFVRLQDPLQARTMSMDWILALSKWMLEMEKRPACRIPVWLAQGALDQTVDWRYNLAFIRRKFRLQTALILEEGSHQLINERKDIRAALTGLIPAFLHAETARTYYQ